MKYVDLLARPQVGTYVCKYAIPVRMWRQCVRAILRVVPTKGTLHVHSRCDIRFRYLHIKWRLYFMHFSSLT